ncbi:unnamed protein product [Closterium sp. NIES-65]|nr:unnamed protein product [Closterium sp. NIES-65]
MRAQCLLFCPSVPPSTSIPRARGRLVTRSAIVSRGGRDEGSSEDNLQQPGPLLEEIPSFSIPNPLPFRSLDFPNAPESKSGVASVVESPGDADPFLCSSAAMDEATGRSAGRAGAAGQEQMVGVKWLAKARQQALQPTEGNHEEHGDGKGVDCGEGEKSGKGGDDEDEDEGVEKSLEEERGGGNVLPDVLPDVLPVLAADVERFIRALDELKREAVSLGIPGYALPRVEKEEDLGVMVKKLVEARNEVMGIIASRLSSNL